MADNKPNPPVSGEIETPGQRLRAVRQEYGWNVEEVADELRLSPAIIRALEGDRYEGMPGRTYVLGYIRSYANLLVVPIEDSIAAWRESIPEAPSDSLISTSPVSHRSPDGSVPEPRVGMKLVTVAALVGLVIGVLATWQYLGQSGATISQVSDPVAETESETSAADQGIVNSSDGTDNAGDTGTEVQVAETNAETVQPSAEETAGEVVPVQLPEPATESQANNNDDDAAPEEVTASNDEAESDALTPQLGYHLDVPVVIGAWLAEVAKNPPLDTEIRVDTVELVRSVIRSDTSTNAQPAAAAPEETDTSQETQSVESQPSDSDQSDIQVASVAEPDSVMETTVTPAPEEESESTAEVAPTDVPEASSDSQPVVTAALSPEAVDNADARILVMMFDQSSWADVRDDAGRRLLSQTVDSGSTLELEGEPPFTIFLGNASGVRVRHMNEEQQLAAPQPGMFARFVIGSETDPLEKTPVPQ